MKATGILTALLIVALVGSSANAAVLASDSFSYTGALTSNGWTAHSGAGNKVIMADGSIAVLDQSSGSGEDVHMPFAAQGAAATTYATIDFMVPSGTTVNPDASGLYFFHLGDSGFNFRARTGIVVPAGGGDFGLAINNSSSNLGAGTSWASDLSFDTWYNVVVSYDATTATSTLWLDAANSGSTSITHTDLNTGTDIERVAVRQSNDFTGLINIDNVGAGTTFETAPEPATIALLGLGGLALIRRRR